MSHRVREIRRRKKRLVGWCQTPEGEGHWLRNGEATSTDFVSVTWMGQEGKEEKCIGTGEEETVKEAT